MAKTKIIRLIMLLVLIAALITAYLFRDQMDLAAIKAVIERAGWAAPLIFIITYAMAAVLFLPGLVLTLLGGALFGPYWGVIYNLTGATLGATCAFLVARYLASDWVKQKSGGRVKQLVEGVEKEGWRFVAFVRLVPLFPFNLLNYALGLTKIKLSHYVIASFICMAPAGAAYTYLGYAGAEAVAGGEGVIKKGLLALGLIVLVTFLPRFIKHFRTKP